MGELFCMNVLLLSQNFHHFNFISYYDRNFNQTHMDATRMVHLFLLLFFTYYSISAPGKFPEMEWKLIDCILFFTSGPYSIHILSMYYLTNDLISNLTFIYLS